MSAGVVPIDAFLSGYLTVPELTEVEISKGDKNPCLISGLQDLKL